MCRWSAFPTNTTKLLGLFLYFLLLFDIVNGHKILHYNVAVAQLIKKLIRYLYMIKKKLKPALLILSISITNSVALH